MHSRSYVCLRAGVEPEKSIFVHYEKLLCSPVCEQRELINFECFPTSQAVEVIPVPLVPVEWPSLIYSVDCSIW